MGPQRCRLPARIVLSTLLAALGLSMAAVGAEAASNGLTLAVHVGYQDVVKPGEWTPVTVDAHNTGADVDGTLEVRESLNAQPGVTGFTIYQQPISLASGASKRRSPTSSRPVAICCWGRARPGTRPWPGCPQPLFRWSREPP